MKIIKILPLGFTPTLKVLEFEKLLEQIQGIIGIP